MARSYAAEAIPLYKVNIDISGVEDAVLDNINAHSGVEKFSEEKRKRVSIRRWYENSGEIIKKSIQALGYYQSKIDSSINLKDGVFYINYQIKLGDKVVIRDVSVKVVGEGETDKQFKAIVKELNSLSGKALNHGAYESLKADLTNVSVNKGYFDSKFLRKEIIVDVKKNEASIFIDYETGKRYRFGAVVFSEGALDKEFLEKFIPFSYGDYYDSGKIIKLRTRLLSSRYFQTVSVQRGEKPEGSLFWAIIVDFETILPHKYDYGLGYATDSGARVSFGYSNRLSNEFGHRYKTKWLYSEKVRSAIGEYEFPDQDPLHDIYKLRLGYDYENLDYGKSTKYSAGVQRIHIKEGEWTRTLYLNYSQERYEVADDNGITTLLTPGISWIQSKSNNRRYPTKGWRGSIDLYGGLEGVGSEFSFAQGRVGFKYIYGFWDDFRVILRSEVGGTYIEDGDYDKLPPSLRFFAGGDNSVRGYGFKTLSSEEDGEAIGGRYLLVGSSEIDYRIAEDWGIALFVDTGNAFESTKENLYVGKGFGVRWYSPVGPLRFNIAWPEAAEAKDFKIHISIGPDL